MALGVALLAAAGGALAATRTDRQDAPPEVDASDVPVRITPVVDLDAPLLKLGGERDATKLPDRTVRQTPKPRVEQRAFVSSRAGKTVEEAPPPDVKMATSEATPPPPSAELAKQVDTPAVAALDARAPSNVDQRGHADGVKEGTELDPLKARAVDLYRAKIAAWFGSRFRVSGSGLTNDDLLRYRVAATVSLGADRTVAAFSIVESGNAAFDAAARTTLERAKGQTLPPPPENYPEVAQSRISVTFVCRENRCD
jgi:hypothetical protein